ncbi:MAG: preprotein translocase subunit SecA [Spirochaetales bacterium]|nr:preprotein translocase subunit SecA [Spirochaetales bacterium]
MRIGKNRRRPHPAYRLARLRGIGLETDLKPYLRTINEIKRYDFRRCSDARLAARAGEVKRAARAGEPGERLLPEVFALAAEAAARRLGMRPFDEQLLAGTVMGHGKLAELATGEGKTLAAVFPAALRALSGRGVHVMTANDYLAARDAAWMEPVYRALGLSAAAVAGGMSAARRRAAYAADVTYVTAKQAGFDFLRDSLAYDPAEIVHRELYFALVDEADFILIDEARVPLVLAAADDMDVDDPGVDPARCDEAARSLTPGADFVLDRAGRSLHLTVSGERRAGRLLGVGGMHRRRDRLAYAGVYVALLARHLLRRDVDYIVRRGRIELVDELTGRVARDRRWPDGIQAALEVKERLAVRPAGRIFGSITIRHFLNLYPRRAAMTATAAPAAREFNLFYGLDVVVVPTRLPVRRSDEPDAVFLTRAAKNAALLDEVERAHRAGRPILIGTRSVRESEELARDLRRRGLACRVLNAKNDRREAAVIARAGLPGAITISTNMAGRGTDIKLGGMSGSVRRRVTRAGGLYVIGTGRHESVRIDRQLRGRAGRQGDPGTSRFFVSLEDELFRRYGVAEFLPRKALMCARDDPHCAVADRRVNREIERAQSIIGHQNHLIRRTLRRYSLLVEEQRRAVQEARRPALLEEELPEVVARACAPELGRLRARLGDAAARRLGARIFLAVLDRFWADHLATVEELREGIALQRFGAREPLHEFIRLASERFAEGLARVAAECRAEARAALKTNDGGAGYGTVRAPSSTWTYALDDEPLPAFNLAGFAGGPAALVGAVMLLVKTVGAWAAARREKAAVRSW